MKRISQFSLIVIALVCLLVSSVAARKDKAKEAAVPTGPLKIPVWVQDDSGAFWEAGRRENFKVFLDDQEVPVKGLQSPRSSTIVLVVFDTVADLTRVDTARAALQEKLEKLGNQYWVGLLSAQDGLSVIEEPSAERTKLIEKVRAVQVSGKAGLLDTLEPVSRLATAMLQKANVRLSVLYVTDSSIGHYRADYLNPVINSSDRGDLSRRFADRAVQERMSRLAETLAPYQVPLFILHLAYRGDELNLAYQSGLERIAAESSGQAVFCRTTEEIQPAIETLFARLRGQYVLTLELPETKRQSVKLRVVVQDPSGKQYSRVTHPSNIALRR